MPLPRVLHDLAEQGKARRPAELALQAIAGRKQRSRIAWPARGGRPLDRLANDLTDGLNHLSHRLRLTRPGIVSARGSTRLERAKGRILPVMMGGGLENPLGARALYLGSTLYRIHGTNAPWTIGTNVSSGCIRMRNEDVIDLYGRVNVGARVVVI